MDKKILIIMLILSLISYGCSKNITADSPEFTECGTAHALSNDQQLLIENSKDEVFICLGKAIRQNCELAHATIILKEGQNWEYNINSECNIRLEYNGNYVECPLFKMENIKNYTDSDKISDGLLGVQAYNVAKNVESKRPNSFCIAYSQGNK